MSAVRLFRYITAAASAVVVTVLAAAPAAASWSVSAAGQRGAAKAHTIPAGMVTSATAVKSTVTVTWAARELAAGVPVDGYRVTRQSAQNGPVVDAGAGCAGLVTALRCSEDLPNGTYLWRVTPVLRTWVGATSVPVPVTVAVAVPAVAFSPIPSAKTGPSATFHFGAGSGHTVECRLDGGQWAACTSPHTRTGLTGGTHTIAVRAKDRLGNVGTATSHTWTVDAAGPRPQSVQSVPSPRNGRVQDGERLELTFDEAVDPESIVSGYTSGMTVYVRLRNGSTDVLEFYGAYSLFGGVANPLPLGAVDLGSDEYTNNSIVYAATIVVSGAKVTITLGDVVSLSGPRTARVGGDMVWTVGGGIQDTVGNAGPAASVTESPLDDDLDF